MNDNQILYDQIGGGYNATRRADPYITGELFWFLLPRTEGQYLDIGCGTGNYTIELSNRGLHLYGVEPSAKMLDIARSRSTNVKWVKGQAEQIPVEGQFFDGIVATLTIHHWGDLGKAFKELHRVLKADGKIVLFTALPAQMQGYWLNYYFPKMLADSIAQMPALDVIESAAAGAGFKITGTEKYFIQPDLQDLFLYSGKNSPSVYFKEDVRKGISSFSALANREEVERGLLLLRQHVGQGGFEAVRSQFDDGQGDYLFITMGKC